ncbi:trypsin-like peptidase domain-containing protein [Neorhodopirellula pilleata]|nr:trypsin-like peptidase domain-containing protein [Neorhodopirellula pilleata]
MLTHFSGNSIVSVLALVSVHSMTLADEPELSARWTPATAVIRDLQPAVGAVYSFRDNGRASGSGSLVDPRGFLLTVAHVVGDQHVVLLGGRPPLRASLIGKNPEFDLAVLELGGPAFNRPGAPDYPLDGKPFAFIRLGIADEVMLGETILNLGSPGGRGIVVTSGIVSATSIAGGNALALATQDSNGFQQYLQFDAASNPGNSGGAIVNLDAQQIGVVTSSIRGEEGIHFAVPIDVVRRCLADLLHCELRHRYVSGIEIDPQRPDVMVTGVATDSPAFESGLQIGEEVVAVDGRRLRDPIDWEFTKFEWKPDQNVILTVRRTSEEKQTELDLPIQLIPRNRDGGIEVDESVAAGLICRTSVYDPQIPDPLSDDQRPKGTPQVVALPTATPPNLPRDDHYELGFEGLIEIKEAGLYRLGAKSDDGSKVYFHDRLVADNGGNHASQLRTGWIDAAPGKHPIRIEYYEDEGNELLELYLAKGDDEPRLIQASELFHVVAP